jgi:hypothetical protein
MKAKNKTPSEVAASYLGQLKDTLIYNLNHKESKDQYGRFIPIGSCRVTIESKILKQILLQTGGLGTVIAGATVFHWQLRKNPLGLGVYNVWLATVESGA